MPPSVRPTGVERTFADDEIIVTKTDPQGRITYANEVFLRMSALTEAEALGAPHSLIRHPDMPRGVFRLLWQTISQGQEMFAYVVNLAADGAHYWVFAHVTPTFDRSGRILGYHSNRRVPDRGGVAAVQDMYRRLRAVEQAQITQQVRTMLDATIQSRGAMESIEGTVRDMAPMVDDLLVAVDGHPPQPGRPAASQGLAQMAEALRAEVLDLLVVMRSS